MITAQRWLTLRPTNFDIWQWKSMAFWTMDIVGKFVLKELVVQQTFLLQGKLWKKLWFWHWTGVNCTTLYIGGREAWQELVSCLRKSDSVLPWKCSCYFWVLHMMTNLHRWGWKGSSAMPWWRSFSFCYYWPILFHWWWRESCWHWWFRHRAFS